MSKLHKGYQFHTKKVEPREGRREPLCNNRGKSRCPSLRYNYIEGNQENINRAFDVLFGATLQENK